MTVDESFHEDRVLHDALVDDLVAREYIRTKPVEDAFRAVPRHAFVPHVEASQAYSDQSISIADTSSSSQPAIMAAMLEQLALGPGLRVLEIGTGSGYNAALMAQIVGAQGHVVTIDVDRDLITAAREHLHSVGAGGIEAVCGDGGFGHPAGAPYDRVIVTAGAGDIAPAWREQLRDGGRLVLPLALTSNVQKAVAFDKRNGRLESVSAVDCGFMMLQGAFAAPDAAVQLGGDAGLYLSVGNPDRLDLDAVNQRLRGPYTDRPSGVVTTAAEVWGPLNQWLALHLSEFCSLSAWGDTVDEGLVPSLLGGFDDVKVAQAGGLVSSHGLCLLAPPTGPGDHAQGCSDDEEFELLVRDYGESRDLADRLLASLVAWRDAGRPGADRLRVTAHPTSAEPRLAADEALVMRPHSKLVFAWADME